LAFSFWPLAFSFWPLAFSFWPLAFSFWPLAFSFWLLDFYQQPITNSLKSQQYKKPTAKSQQPKAKILNFT